MHEIPKIIHFIWAGGEKLMPDENIDILSKWAFMNPDFSIWLWVDSETSGRGETSDQRLQWLRKYYINKVALLDRFSVKDINEEKVSNEFIRYEIDRFTPNYGASSDILRYQILYKFGGAYFDTDVEPPMRKNVEAIHHSSQKQIPCVTLSGLIEKFQIHDHVLHVFYIDHLPQMSNTNLVVDKLRKFGFSNKHYFGNDAFICTRNNPLMKRVYEKSISNYNLQDLQALYRQQNSISETITLVRICYANANRLFHTLNMTGPSHLRSILLDKKPVEDPFFNTENVFIKNIDNQMVHLVPLRTSEYIAISPKEINTLNWLRVPQRRLPQGEIIKNLISEIQFEIANLRILRLDDHMDVLKSSSDLMPLIDEFFIKLSELKLEGIKIVQLSFRHKETYSFYEKHKLLKLSFLIDMDSEEITKEVFDCALNKRILEEMAEDFENRKYKEHYSEFIIREKIKLMRNAVIFLRGYLEAMSNKDLAVDSIQFCKEVLEKIKNAIGFYLNDIERLKQINEEITIFLDTLIKLESTFNYESNLKLLFS